jgi:hypothetical protein
MKTIAYLGQMSHHAENLAILLRSQGLGLHLIEDSVSQGVYNQSKFPSRGTLVNPLFRNWAKACRAFSQLYGTFDETYCKQLTNQIDECKIDCVLAYWGTNPLADIVFLKRARPGTRIILNVLCHPMGISHSKILYQNYLINKSSKFIDGFIFSSNEMRSYFEKNCDLRASSLVMPSYLSKEYSSPGKGPPIENSPNLVFLGRMDWNAGQPSDNVEAELWNMMQSGIHVFHSRSVSGRPSHKNQHEFEPLDIKKLSPFMAKFDASLIVYNMDACRRRDRFRNTIPDRLLSSVAAGIPIAIPRDGYDACKEFLEAYRAVIEYDSPGELKEKLADRTFIDKMKKFAKHDHVQYFGEKHIASLVEFIKQV